MQMDHGRLVMEIQCTMKQTCLTKVHVNITINVKGTPFRTNFLCHLHLVQLLGRHSVGVGGVGGGRERERERERERDGFNPHAPIFLHLHLLHVYCTYTCTYTRTYTVCTCTPHKTYIHCTNTHASTHVHVHVHALMQCWTYSIKVERRRFKPDDCDVVLIVSHEVGEETEEHGVNLLVHQLLRLTFDAF